jgi:hypothetical protein
MWGGANAASILNVWQHLISPRDTIPLNLWNGLWNLSMRGETIHLPLLEWLVQHPLRPTTATLMENRIPQNNTMSIYEDLGPLNLHPIDADVRRVLTLYHQTFQPILAVRQRIIAMFVRQNNVELAQAAYTEFALHQHDLRHGMCLEEILSLASAISVVPMLDWLHAKCHYSLRWLRKRNILSKIEPTYDSSRACIRERFIWFFDHFHFTATDIVAAELLPRLCANRVNGGRLVAYVIERFALPYSLIHNQKCVALALESFQMGVVEVLLRHYRYISI